jgi:hypothetical protein
MILKMAEKKDMLKKYYSERGVEALKSRLKTLSGLFITQKEFPFKARLFGFPLLEINDKKELGGRIQELKDILMGVEVVFERKE